MASDRRSDSRVAGDEAHAGASVGRRVSIDVAPATAIAIKLRDDRNRPLLPFQFVPMKGGNAQFPDDLMNESIRPILFSNGSRGGALLGFRRLGMPVFSARSQALDG
jgi:hypothetical protein